MNPRFFAANDAGAVVPASPPGPDAPPLATFRDINLFQQGAPALAAAAPPAAPAIIVWSGTPADSLFERSPLAWTSDAWQRLASLSAEAAAACAAAGRTLVLRPHTAHVLSDVQRCVRWLNESARPAGAGLVLDPLSLLTPDMLPAAEDHLRRIFETLAGEARALWLAEIPQSPALRDLLTAAAARWTPPELPVIAPLADIPHWQRALAAPASR
ncbi:MAG: hypothetical protein SFZ24_03210 [Planctomycetota bacterium]|nr:hypothetical protein [Planctomycetota bacterium]